jgi:hypothetical protein
MSEPQKVPLGAALLAILACAFVPVIPYMIDIEGHDDARIEALEKKLRDLEVRVEMAHAAERKLTQFRAEVARLKQEAAKPPCSYTSPHP